MKYIKMFDSFNANEKLNITGDFEDKKSELDALFPYGCIDSDHYEYFNCDSEQDLEDRIKWGEINNDSINDAIKAAVETVFPESEGFSVDCHMYHGDEKCGISVAKGEDSLQFDLVVDI